MSDALGDDRRVQEVGPYKIEVISRSRSCASRATPRNRASPSTSRGTRPSPAHEKPQHQTLSRELAHPRRRAALRAGGQWEGWMKVDDQEWEVSPDTWVAPATGRGASGRSASSPAPGPPNDARWPQLLVALHADPLRRRRLPLRHRPGRRRRQTRGSTKRCACGPTAASNSSDGPRWRSRTAPRHSPSGTRGDAPP